MLLRIAHNLRSCSIGVFDIEVNPSYSGRGMFGKTTAAITCDNKNVFYQAITFCASVLTMRGLEDEFNELVGELASIREDSLGNQRIFY